MTYRIMFDSVDPAAIPADAELVGYYVDGKYAWPLAALQRFPNAQLVGINVTGDPSHGGSELDVENGDATPAHAPGWYDERTKAGAKGLSIYCNRANLPAVEAAMGTRSYFRRVATLDGTLAINGYQPLKGPAAIQFAGSSAVGGLNVDVSLVISDYYHPQPSLAQVVAAAKNTQAEAASLLTLLAKYTG